MGCRARANAVVFLEEGLLLRNDPAGGHDVGWLNEGVKGDGV